MITYAYGHDFGNAETCGVTFAKGKRLSRVIPSAIAQGSYDDLSRLGVKLKAEHYIIRLQGNTGEQFVGDLALEQAQISFSGRGDIGRYWSEKSLIMLLTTACSLIHDDEFGLNVVTGLPVETYLGDPECRKRIRAALEGTHTFTFGTRERRVHVTCNRVIMEGAGAAIAYGTQEKMVQGVIDIGGRTTDLYVTEGQTPLRHRCTGSPLGVEIAGDLLSTNFQRKYGRPLTRIEIRRILWAHAAKDQELPRVVARGKEVPDLADLVREALHQIGNEIVSFVARSWGESEGSSEVASSFASVLSIGGGTLYFYDQLQEIIPNLQFIKQPEMANAYGYAVFAESQVQRARAVS